MFKVTDDIARNKVFALPTQLHHFWFPIGHTDIQCYYDNCSAAGVILYDFCWQLYGNWQHWTVVKVLKSSVFWDIMPCSPLKATCFHWFLAWLIFWPWRWKQHVPSKRWLIFNGLHDVMSQKVELFVTTMRTSNPTFDYCCFQITVLSYHYNGKWLSSSSLCSNDLPGSYQAINNFLSHSEITRTCCKHNVQVSIANWHYIYNGIVRNMRDVCRHHCHYDTQYHMMSLDIITAWLVKKPRNSLPCSLRPTTGPYLKPA
jgi:hypothetical protein